ncbi:MAG: GGDEF domain-containing protein [Lachnospirales bacterium]
MRKYFLYIFIVVLITLCAIATEGFISPSADNFISVANLNTEAIDEYMSKSIEFSYTARDRLIDHIKSKRYDTDLDNTYEELFVQNSNDFFSYTDEVYDYKIVGKGSYEELFDNSLEFNLLFNLPTYFENFYTTSNDVLRTYYISASDFAIMYPNPEGVRITFDELYKKYLFVPKATTANDNGILYVYDVHEDIFTGESIISFHTPVNIDNIYYGSIVVDIKTEGFNDITLKNYDSFTTSMNMKSVIYSDVVDDSKVREYTGEEILEIYGLSRDFKKNIIESDFWTENLSGSSKVYISDNNVIYQATMDTIPIEYYQIATFSEIFEDVTIQLFLLGCMTLFMTFYIIVLIILRVRTFVLEHDLSKLSSDEKELVTQVNTDFVTGLKNYRYVNMKLESLNDNTVDCYSIAICDISFYSETMEVYGDKVAQNTLIRFIESAKNIVNENVLIARWNEEQLIFIFHEVEGEGVVANVDEVRKAANMLVLKVDEKDSARIVVSFGVASNNNKSVSPYKTLAEADKALQTSLKRGGNVVTIHSDRIRRS